MTEILTAEQKKSVIERNGYTLTLTDESGRLDSQIKNKLIEIFFKVYPEMAARFNAEAARKISFIIISDPKVIAYCAGTKIVFSVEWFERMPQDTDCATHELMHAVQSYPTYDHAWVVEGLADYARYKYGVDNVGWSLPQYDPRQKYTDSYRVTGRFLAWLEKRVCENIIELIDDRLRNGTFSIDIFVEATGKTVDELWSMYAENSEL